MFIPDKLTYQSPPLKIKEKSSHVIKNAVVTFYTSSEDETDNTPHITASNQKTRSGIVANNCLPFGTRVIIDYTSYEVQDRMNRRYGCSHFDIWVETKDVAYELGKQVHDVLLPIAEASNI